MKKNSQNTLPTVLFIIYLLILTGIILFDLPSFSLQIPDGVRSFNLIPLQGSFDENGQLVLFEIVRNILVFIPFGFYISILKSKASFIRKLLPFLCVSLAFEVIQFIFALGRFDTTDILANTLGGITGICIYALSFEFFKKKTIKFFNISSLLITICIVIYFFYSLYSNHFNHPQSLPVFPVNTVPVHGSIPHEESVNISESSVSQIDQSTGNILLVNANNPLPEDFQPENLVNLFEQQDRNFDLAKADIEIAQSVFEAMNTMFSAANADGVSGFIITSGYRSRENQAEIFASTTDGFAAKPGESEHETGLAFDVVAMGDENFELTPQFAWLSAHCAEYGFIIRYPKDMEDITGISYEPWHYRYVGIPYAKEIMDRGITLEEYLGR